jgi:hypothetical protein
LLHKFGNSLSKALAAAYPEIQWEDWMFQKVSRGFWSDTTNTRRFFTWLGKQIGVKSQEDWYSVTGTTLHRYNAYRVLSNFNNSISTALVAAFPELTWHRWKFYQAPKGFWKQPDNAKEFLEHLKLMRNIKKPLDWAKVTGTEIGKLGGSGLLQTYGNLDRALKILCNEDLGLNTFKLSNPQQKLWKELQQLNLAADFQVNYRHPLLVHPGTKRQMEFDFFSPSLSLAIEFQGAQHYTQAFHSDNLQRQQERDQEKRDSCKIAGIRLVEIAFFDWNENVSQLKKWISEAPKLEPPSKPQTTLDGRKTAPIFRLQDNNFLLAVDWRHDTDPRGWYSDASSNLTVLGGFLKSLMASEHIGMAPISTAEVAISFHVQLRSSSSFQKVLCWMESSGEHNGNGILSSVQGWKRSIRCL